MRDVGTVRALQDDLKDEHVDVLLVDIHDEVGDSLARRFAFRVTPTYIIFDEDGHEIWRGHSTPARDDILRRLDDPL